MKIRIGMVALGMVTIPHLTWAQTAADWNSGSQLIPSSVPGAYDFSWWGATGRTYFIQMSEDLKKWTYLNEIVPGTDAVEGLTFTHSGSRGFLRLISTDADTDGSAGGADFDGDGISNADELSGLLGLPTNPLSTDSDEDGWSDDFEIAQGSDPTLGGSRPFFGLPGLVSELEDLVDQYMADRVYPFVSTESLRDQREDILGRLAVLKNHLAQGYSARQDSVQLFELAADVEKMERLVGHPTVRFVMQNRSIYNTWWDFSTPTWPDVGSYRQWQQTWEIDPLTGEIPYHFVENDAAQPTWTNLHAEAIASDTWLVPWLVPALARYGAVNATTTEPGLNISDNSVVVSRSRVRLEADGPVPVGVSRTFIVRKTVGIYLDSELENMVPITAHKHWYQLYEQPTPDSEAYEIAELHIPANQMAGAPVEIPAPEAIAAPTNGAVFSAVEWLPIEVLSPVNLDEDETVPELPMNGQYDDDILASGEPEPPPAASPPPATPAFYPNYAPAEELRIAKLYRALDDSHSVQPGDDPDQFVVGIQRLPSAISSVKIELQTINGPAPIRVGFPTYNDSPDEIELLPAGVGHQTAPLVLMSNLPDDTDNDILPTVVPVPFPSGSDDSNNDQTHLTGLGGTVNIKSVSLNGDKLNTNISLPVKVKAPISVKIRYMADSGMTPITIDHDFQTAREIYVQIGIELLQDGPPLEVPVPADMGPAGTALIASGPSSYFPPPDAQKVLKACSADSTPTDWMVVYCKNVRSSKNDPLDGWGYTRFACAPHPKWGGTAIVRGGATKVTLAHELGHLFTNRGHYGTPGTKFGYPDTMPNDPAERARLIHHNLMRVGNAHFQGFDGPCRLHRIQKHLIYGTN